jgi:hypothetical protein
MAEEFILGMVAGVSIILGPQIYLYIKKLREQIEYLKPTSDSGANVQETLAEKRP